jgi:VWFA-related protein
MLGIRSIIPAIILLTSISGLGQTPKPTPKVDDDIIKVESRLIVVPVSVTDSKGEPVLGMTVQDFSISEENRSQTIESVTGADKVPLEIVLLFDVSASTDAMFQFELETAAKFLKDVMRPEDRATVFTIGSKPVLVQPRSSAEQTASAIKAIQPTKGFTAFYDAVAAASAYLRTNAPEASRRVILVISDGEDTNSERIASAIQDGYKRVNPNTIDSKTLYQLTVANRNQANIAERLRVLKMLQDGDTVFYSINPAGSSYQLNKMSVFGQENLQKFADDTGGAAFLPKFRPISTKNSYEDLSNTRQNAEMLDRIFAQLKAELRAQYLIQYYSETDYPQNKYVKLDVKTPTKVNARVRARQGYYVKK